MGGGSLFSLLSLGIMLDRAFVDCGGGQPHLGDRMVTVVCEVFPCSQNAYLQLILKEKKKRIHLLYLSQMEKINHTE